MLDIERQGGTTVVVASSSSSDVSIDGAMKGQRKEKGGRLISAMYNFCDKSKFPQSCEFDLDKDGIISENEMYMSILVSEIHDTREQIRQFSKTIPDPTLGGMLLHSPGESCQKDEDCGQRNFCKNK